jgi:signal transduction histidine kinase
VTAAELIQYTSDVVFVAIFVAVAARAIRRRRRATLDAVMLFGALAAVIVVSLGSRATGLSGPVTTGFVLIALLALPFLTLRLVDDLVPLPRRVLQVVLAIWALLAITGIGLALIGVVLPREALLAIAIPVILYFAGTEIYGAIAVFRAYRRAVGVLRPRLLAIGAGTLFLGTAILVTIVALIPPLAPFGGVATNLFGLASAISYYLGFSTPAFVRRAWQEPLLRTFMADAVRVAVGNDRAHLVAGLSRAAAQVISADVASVGLWNEATGRIRYLSSNGQTADVEPADSSAGPAFLRQEVIFRFEGDGAGPLPRLLTDAGLHATLAAPITWSGTRYGVLGTYWVRTPFFVEDRVALIDILAGQIALVLRNNDLLSEVRALNTDLERHIGELDAANEELSSFAYAVSHDLRAPLRAIDGFGEILLQDKAPALGEDGRDHLSRVRKAAQHMGELIDALLELSRTSRAELRRAPVNLSALAREIAGQHAQHSPERAVTLRIEDGLQVEADERLLRSVLGNLIGNAWKFTRPVTAPTVEIGAVQHNGSRAFFVRDNGVGFDATYKQKLFTPFQRLHSVREFEGTGIGLATVRRVIRRHGGETWAESTPGKGATFYFTLP